MKSDIIRKMIECRHVKGKHEDKFIPFHSTALMEAAGTAWSPCVTY